MHVSACGVTHPCFTAPACLHPFPSPLSPFIMDTSLANTFCCSSNLFFCYVCLALRTCPPDAAPRLSSPFPTPHRGRLPCPFILLPLRRLHQISLQGLPHLISKALKAQALHCTAWSLAPLHGSGKERSWGQGGSRGEKIKGCWQTEEGARRQDGRVWSGILDGRQGRG